MMNKNAKKTESNNKKLTVMKYIVDTLQYLQSKINDSL